MCVLCVRFALVAPCPELCVWGGHDQGERWDTGGGSRPEPDARGEGDEGGRIPGGEETLDRVSGMLLYATTV